MFLKATDSTPEVDLRFIDGKGWIRGVLRTGHDIALFEKIADHLDFEVGHHQGRHLEIEIDLDEFPSTVMPSIRRILDDLMKRREAGAHVHIKWRNSSDSESVRNQVRFIADKYYKLVDGPDDDKALRGKRASSP